jgi:NAD-dependent dihydropyrimidine dehydrogenase PreA subunit
MEPSRKYVRLLEKLIPHRFIIAKLSAIPVIRWIYSKMIFEKNNLTYLTKDNVVEIALNKKIQPPDSIVVPSKVVECFIEESSFRVIMNFCICREANDCKNYPIEMGCLFMGEAAKKIPKALGKPATKEQALEYVEKCRKIGLVHLIGRDRLDETWLGVGPKIPLVTVCNCCNCCCLWRMLPYLESSLSSTVKRMPGVKIKVNHNCNGCGVCTKEVCFIDAIQIIDGVAVINNKCLACGRCVEHCPSNAIELLIEDKDFIKKTIERVKKATC